MVPKMSLYVQRHKKNMNLKLGIRFKRGGHLTLGISEHFPMDFTWICNTNVIGLMRSRISTCVPEPFFLEKGTHCLILTLNNPHDACTISTGQLLGAIDL